MVNKIPTISLKKDAKESLLPKDFGVDNINLLAQAIHVFHSRSHAGLAKVKTRAEVNRTTKKVYRQKHTGNARHGSKKAPIFVGGGVTFGPRGVKRFLTLPKKMSVESRKAAFQFKSKMLCALDGISKVDKTKDAATLIDLVLAKFDSYKSKKVLVLLSKENKEKRRFFKNIKGVSVNIFNEVSAFDVFKGGIVAIDSTLVTQKEAKEKKAKKEIKK